MQLEKIPLPDTHSFSSFFLDYISGAASLKPFYHLFPVPENFAQQIRIKADFPESSRKVLTECLRRQYSALQPPAPVMENIRSLDSGATFTVTTGHQLNIFTGPMYFVFKIVTAINACKVLRKQYPEYNFVPVYWMASEDHDFEEISYFILNGKKYQWQTAQTGAVGRFNPAELAPMFREIPGDVTIFEEAYRQKTLSDAVRYYVNALFGSEGIVVLDADDRELKRQLIPVMRSDFFDHVPHALVERDTEKLKGMGYATPVHAREINFFYLDKGIRDRIETEDDHFRVVNQDITFRRDDLLQAIETTPEKFSPNVVLRPLYQEIILPNLAYIGGPSELIYWLQLKGVFDHFKVAFPLLVPRNFGVVMDHTVLRKFDKSGLELKDFFEEKNYLFNHWILKNSAQNLTLGTAIGKIRELFAQIEEQAAHIDPTLAPHVQAKGKQTLHHLEVMEKKMLRAEKRRHAEKIGQLETVKDSLFPGGHLQERTDSFLNFYQPRPGFIADLLEAFDPFDYRMHVLKYHD